MDVDSVLFFNSVGGTVNRILKREDWLRLDQRTAKQKAASKASAEKLKAINAARKAKSSGLTAPAQPAQPAQPAKQ